MSNRGRPRKWIDKKDIDYGRALLKCNLIDRIYRDEIIGKNVLNKRSVSLGEAFWICDGLTQPEVAKALRMSSEELSSILVDKDIRRNSGSGSRLRDFYYTWYKPSNAILRTVGRRVDTLRAKGETLTEAIRTVGAEGLHPQRRTNKEFLPAGVIRNFYYRFKKLNL